MVDDGGDPPPPAPADLTLYLRRFLPRLSVALPALSGGGADVGLEVTASSDEHPAPVAGFIVALTGTLALAQDRGGWHLELNASGDVPAFVVGADGVALAPGAGAVSGEVHLVMRRIALPGEPAFRLGSTTGTRLELGTASVSINLRFGPERSAISVAFDTAPSALILAPGDGDGFLRAILANDARLTLDLGASLSTDGGLKLKGGVGLSSRSPATLSFGPLTVSGATLGVSVGAASVRLDATCDLSLTLGPVRVGVAGIGMGFDVGVPEVRDGWPVSLDTDFVPPTGATLAIDAGPIRGGGFLHRETARYHGGLALDVFGLAPRRVWRARRHRQRVFSRRGGIGGVRADPDRVRSGFTLDGVGGLSGINRRVDVEALRATSGGPGTGDIFFAADPVAHAARLTTDLARYFPAAAGDM